MTRHNIMWNLTMLRVMNAIEIFTAAHPLSNQNKEEYKLACQLTEEYNQAKKTRPTSVH